MPDCSDAGMLRPVMTKSKQPASVHCRKVSKAFHNHSDALCCFMMTPSLRNCCRQQAALPAAVWC